MQKTSLFSSLENYQMQKLFFKRTVKFKTATMKQTYLSVLFCYLFSMNHFMYKLITSKFRTRSVLRGVHNFLRHFFPLHASDQSRFVMPHYFPSLRYKYFKIIATFVLLL